ncbi:sensor histidine kinase [Marinoscillum pacificum]|uniref:sensor histidine kinase n=1 Tax=Marinoscillum pacificum TaxID=392723 RepID=UPI0021581EE0|nr:sensor histidine kinase [Marinoscillum pacificum]
MKSKLIKIVSLTWLQHLAFWMLSIAFITFYFAISGELSFTDVIYSLCFHLCIFPMIYLLLRIIIPSLFEKEKYLLFTIAVSLNVGVGWLLHFLVFNYLVPALLTSYYIVSFTENSILIVIFSVYNILAILLHFSKSWFKVNLLEKDKINLELNLLKNQLNPHFLFNGLNGIYSLSIQNDPRAPEAILKLSDLLRYSLYEVSTELVDLQQELEIIKKYIDIQLIRFKPDRNILVNFSSEGSPKIVPMMLLPIVENAFKHGNLTKEDSFIEISCSYSSDTIVFECKNSFIVKNTDPRSGIGLQSIQKLLELYYEEKGNLTTSSMEGEFIATVKIDLT